VTRLHSTLRIDGLIIDLDGVVWLDGLPIPGSVEAVARLRTMGCRLVFVTNDPTRSAAQYVTGLRRIGIDADSNDVISPGGALAAVVRQREGSSARVFVIGSRPLKNEIRAAGLQLTGDLDVDAVVVGGHPGFHYRELLIATQALSRGARLYAAGRDATFPMPDGPWPGTGSILAAVETASGQRAVVVGKPEAYLFRLASSRLAGAQKVAIVGDSLDADIAGGLREGLMTVLVMTGRTSGDDLAVSTVRPDIAVASLAGLVDRWAELDQEDSSRSQARPT
jgi:glycerol 3-phosphatase-2